MLARCELIHMIKRIYARFFYFLVFCHFQYLRVLTGFCVLMVCCRVYGLGSLKRDRLSFGRNKMNFKGGMELFSTNQLARNSGSSRNKSFVVV